MLYKDCNMNMLNDLSSHVALQHDLKYSKNKSIFI